MTTAIFAVLALAAAGFAYRLLRGPGVPDRLMGLDGLVLVGLAAIAVQAMVTGSGAFLPVLVVLTVVGFVGTAAAARFIERPDIESTDVEPSEPSASADPSGSSGSSGSSGPTGGGGAP